MNELRTIVEAYRIFADEGRRSVLLTLVDVEGSSCRRPGARMLIDEGGEVAGFLGVSPRTVDGDWSMARAWLRRRLVDPSDSTR